MVDALSQRLQQSSFEHPAQEAMLSLLVAASTLNGLMDDVCDRHGITRPQYNVLRILRGAYPQGHARCQIARRMIDRAPDITRLVDRLQERGLVKRVRGNLDQRQAVTSITLKGIRLLERMQPEIAGSLDALMNRLSASDCERLTSICSLLFQDVPEPTKEGRRNGPRGSR